jgi:CRISPR/Cas system-associated exonuclease Cas4 (RecB family)
LDRKTGVPNPFIADAYRIQIGSYCFMLEEMLRESIDKGVIEYTHNNYREVVTYDSTLTSDVIDAVQGAREALSKPEFPPEKEAAKCKYCCTRIACIKLQEVKDELERLY